MNIPQNLSDIIVQKSNQFLILNKPVALPLQPDKTQDTCLLDLAEKYCKHPLKVVHRIDRPASGLVLLAKNKAAAAHISKQFQERLVEKSYLAVVANLPPQQSGELLHFLVKDGRTRKAKILDAATPHAKRVKLHYTVLGSIDNYHLLEIKIVTGRFHQIRAQLAHIGCPIKGDVKYGARRKNQDRGIHLHAWKMRFSHPVSGEHILVEASPPADNVWNAFDFLSSN